MQLISKNLIWWKTPNVGHLTYFDRKLSTFFYYAFIHFVLDFAKIIGATDSSIESPHIAVEGESDVIEIITDTDNFIEDIQWYKDGKKIVSSQYFSFPGIPSRTIFGDWERDEKLVMISHTFIIFFLQIPINSY